MDPKSLREQGQALGIHYRRECEFDSRESANTIATCKFLIACIIHSSNVAAHELSAVDGETI